MTVAIIGLGLIGGSMAKDLRKTGFAQHIIGTDLSVAHQQEALSLGLVDEILPWQEAVNKAQLIVLAVPVDACLSLLPQILDAAPKGVVITDVGSTKKHINKSISLHPNRAQFVGAHPMSGTENSGPTAALEGLFQNKVAIVCAEEYSAPEAVKTVVNFYTAIGCNIIEMDADTHDEHVGYVSHLSHIISYVLANAVLEKEKSDANIFNLAAGGFASTARLAKSASSMWTPIFMQNAHNILPIMDVYLEKLLELRGYIKELDDENVSKFISQANKIRKVLEEKPKQ